MKKVSTKEHIYRLVGDLKYYLESDVEETGNFQRTENVIGGLMKFQQDLKKSFSKN